MKTCADTQLHNDAAAQGLAGYELLRRGPYVAKSASEKTEDWPFWYVCGPDGINCLRFPREPGAVFTSRSAAEWIADDANSKRRDANA